MYPPEIRPVCLTGRNDVLRMEKALVEKELVEMRVDCDRDCLLVLVEQAGPACHTGRMSCFYTEITKGYESELMSPDG